MKVNKTLLITAGCAVFAGAVISSVAATRMINTHVKEDKTVTREITDSVTRLDISTDYGAVNIMPSDSDKITVEYTESDVIRYDVRTENGALIIKPEDVKKATAWFDRIVNIDFHPRKRYILNVKIPVKDTPDAELENSFGAIEIKDCKFKTVSCSVDLGGLKLHNVTADDIDIESDCGDVELKNVSASIKAECDMGAIRLDRVKGKNIRLYNDCGDISGTILGKEEDYSIKSETECGKSNLQNRAGGQNSLEAKVDMGSIDIKFTD